MEQRLACQFHCLEVAGSNPAPATILEAIWLIIVKVVRNAHLLSGASVADHRRIVNASRHT